MTIFHHDTNNGPDGDDMLPLWNQIHDELARRLPGQPALARSVMALYRGVWHATTASDPFLRISLSREFDTPGDARGLPEILTRILMMVAIRSERRWAKHDTK